MLDPFSVSTVEEVHALQLAFDGFVGSTLSELEGSLTELNELATQIKGTGHSETTYSEYDLDTLSGKWSKTQANVEQRRALLASEATKQAENEALRVEWANAAKEFSEWVDGQEARLNEKSSSVDKNKLEEEVAELKALSQELKSHHSKLDNLIALGGKVDAAGITENKHSELTLEGLKMKWDKLNNVADSTVTLLENELISRSTATSPAMSSMNSRKCSATSTKTVTKCSPSWNSSLACKLWAKIPPTLSSTAFLLNKVKTEKANVSLTSTPSSPT